ncbi:MAG: hypothetical protein OEY79_01670 [Anaplasmataceae bacterium]|nr:hypothetical protein [Anaplasmataceae bacterium]
MPNISHTIQHIKTRVTQEKKEIAYSFIPSGALDLDVLSLIV